MLVEWSEVSDVHSFEDILLMAQCRLEGVRDHIIRTTHPARPLDVLLLCQEKFCVRNPAVALVAGNPFSMLCFLQILHIIYDVAHRLRDAPAFSCM